MLAASAWRDPHTVAGRTSEIGVRMALATRPSVVGMIRGVFTQVAWGVAIRWPAALAGGRIVADQLFASKAPTR